MPIDHISETSVSETSDHYDVLRRYAIASAAVVIALLLRQLIFPLLGANNPYHTVWAAVVFSAWYCGLGPSVVTALLSVVGVWYWFL